MLIWSSETGEPPLTVILALRRLVFICGETDAIVPLMMVPIDRVGQPAVSGLMLVENGLPVLSSTVTVSLVHFMRNLVCPVSRDRVRAAFTYEVQHVRFARARERWASLPDELHGCFGAMARVCCSEIVRYARCYGPVV